MADGREGHRLRERAAPGRRTAGAALALVMSATACIGPPLPSESIEVRIGLEPGASQTVSFRTVVSSMTDGHLEITMTPPPRQLEARGIEVSQRSIIDGRAPLDVWPDRFDQAPIETEKTQTVDFDLELTNTTSERQSLDLLVRVQANSNDLPQPFPEDVSITLTER